MSNQDSRNNGRFPTMPMLLVIAGVLFLLRNFGTLPDANWNALFQLWPLGLIFVGLNLIVQNGSQPIRGILSGLLGLTAVAIVIFVLFFSEDNAFLARLGVRTTPTELMSETISYDPQEISSAEVVLNFSAIGGNIYALEPSGDLINGEVYFTDSLIFETEETDEEEAKVELDTNNNPFSWFQTTDDQRWQIGLNPNTPIDLEINSGAGSVDFDLASLTLTDLNIDLGAGSSAVTLPDGNYEFDLDIGAGSTRVVFPENGRISANFDGGAGSFAIIIPEGIPARVDVSSGLGSINLDDRFELVQGERNGDGVWETADYSGDGERIELFVDVGAGSLRVDEDR